MSVKLKRQRQCDDYGRFQQRRRKRTQREDSRSAWTVNKERPMQYAFRFQEKTQPNSKERYMTQKEENKYIRSKAQGSSTDTRSPTCSV